MKKIMLAVLIIVSVLTASSAYAAGKLSADNLFNKGSQYSLKGEYDKAIEAFSKAIELKPDFVAAYNNRGIAYYRKGQFDKAIENYNKAIALDPNNADIYYNRGLAYERKEQFDKAIENYNKAIALDPNDIVMCFQLGQAYYLSEMYNETIETLTKCLNIDRTAVNLYFLIGRSYIGLKHYDKAVEAFENYIRLTTNSLRGHFSLGSALFRLSKYNEAIESYKKSLQIINADDKANIAILHTNIGIAYENLNNFTDAYREYQKALEVDPTLENARRNIIGACKRSGVQHIEQKRYNDALRVLGECLKLSEDTGYLADIHFHIGRAHYQVGNDRESVNSNLQSIRLVNSWSTYVNLGLAYNRLGDYRNAYRAFSKAIEIHPTHERAKKLAERAKAKIKPKDYEIFLDDGILADIGWTNITCNINNTIDSNIAARYGDLRHVIADARLNIGLERTKNMQTFCNTIANVLNSLSTQQLRKFLFLVGKGTYAIEGKSIERKSRKKTGIKDFRIPNGIELYTLAMTKRLYNYSHSTFIKRSRYSQYAFLTQFLDLIKLSGETKTPLPASLRTLLTALMRSNAREAIRLINAVTDKEIAKVIDYSKKKKEEEKVW
jgi:tetratricopeptide (TPR) repeat protein